MNIQINVKAKGKYSLYLHVMLPLHSTVIYEILNKTQQEVMEQYYGWSVTIQMKATEQYSPVVLFIILYKVVLTFESVDEIVNSYRSNEMYLAILLLSLCYCQFFSFFGSRNWNVSNVYFSLVLYSYTDDHV